MKASINKHKQENNDLKKGHIIPLSADDKLIYNGKAQRELYKRYGDPRIPGWGNKWMILWKIKTDFPWFPTEKIYIHKDFKAKLSMAFHSWRCQTCSTRSNRLTGAIT